MFRKKICLQAVTLLVSVFLVTLSISTIWAIPLAPLPHTGLTQCYNSSGVVISCTETGQDAEYQKGVAWPDPRFTDHGDGTVTDNLTGLMWSRDTQEIPGTMTWEEALQACENLILGADGNNTYTDWRLPNIRELHSLIDFSEYDPAIPSDHPFTNVLPSYYWSSTTYLNAVRTWVVYMSVGYAYAIQKRGNYGYVWPVRGGY